MGIDAASNGEEFNPLDYVPEGAEVLDVESVSEPVKTVQTDRRGFLRRMGAVIVGAALGGKAAESAERTSVNLGPVTPENETQADRDYRENVIKNKVKYFENVAANVNGERDRDADNAFYTSVKNGREYAPGYSQEGVNSDEGQVLHKFRIKYIDKKSGEIKYTPWYRYSTHSNFATPKHNPRGVFMSGKVPDDPTVASTKKLD
jgi:hypothetical protein